MEHVEQYIQEKIEANSHAKRLHLRSGNPEMEIYYDGANDALSELRDWLKSESGPEAP